MHGFNYMDGNEKQVLFSESINTEGNYYEILAELQEYGLGLGLIFDAYKVVEEEDNTFLGLQVTFENVAGGGVGNFPWSQECE